VRLGARGTQRLTTQLRLALEPECLENPTATAREIPRDGADSIIPAAGEVFFLDFSLYRTTQDFELQLEVEFRYNVRRLARVKARR
jgi:hypothetical protein